MGQKSIRHNFALNLTNTIVGFLFPLISFPYITRILDPDGIGIFQFYQSIVSYIVLFTALGIPLYALREIAKLKSNPIERGNVTVEILSLHMLLSIIGYAIIAIMCLYVKRVQENIPLFLLLSSSIGFTVIGVSWFYTGVEDFKYITIRSIVVKTISTIAMFCFVHDKADLLVYAAIYVIADVGSNISNFYRLTKYIDYRQLKFSNLNIFRHLKPSIRIFLLNLITSIYTQLNIVMLGFLASNDAVGYFSSSTKIILILHCIIGSLGAVLLPRLSYFFEKRELDDFKKTERKALNFVITITIPLCVGLFCVAPQLIPIFAGNEFAPAILTTQILSPIIFFFAVYEVEGIQVLYAQHKENIIIWSTFFGAVLTCALDFWLIPIYQQNGAAIASLISEAIITVSILIIGRRYIHYNFINRNVGLTLLFSLIMSLPIFAIQYFFSSHLSNILILLTEVTAGIITYILLLNFAKNEFFLEIRNKLIELIHHI